MKNYLTRVVCASALTLFACLLTGCLTKSYEMLSTEFPQVDKQEPSYLTIKEYLRSMTLYEGFETRAQFDVLWLSDDVRSLYAALHSAKVGHNEQEADAFLVRQLEENNHEIVFYVLAEIADQSHVSLSDPNSAWSMHMRCASGIHLRPLSIKEIDMEPEMRFLFGHRFALFKKAYKVRFAAHDLTGALYLAPNQSFTMVCAGAGMSGSLSWHVPLLQKQSVLQKKNALQHKERGRFLSAFADFASPKRRDEDFYW